MNTPKDDAGRLERRVRRLGRIQCPALMDFALFLYSAPYAASRYCGLPCWNAILGK